MFKVYISESAYKGITSSTTTGQSYLCKLLKQQPLQLLKETDTERYKTHPENVLKNPSALYILDISAADALAIQRMYGVMCLSSAAPDISPPIDINDEHTTEKKVPLGRGWDSVLDSVEHLPSNALILNDRYLFKTTNPIYGNGFNKTEGTSEQTIIPQVLFTEDSLNNRSSAPLQSMQQITKALQSFSESLKSSSMNHNSYSYAVNGQRKERCLTITNRLIK